MRRKFLRKFLDIDPMARCGLLFLCFIRLFQWIQTKRVILHVQDCVDNVSFESIHFYKNGLSILEAINNLDSTLKRWHYDSLVIHFCTSNDIKKKESLPVCWYSTEWSFTVTCAIVSKVKLRSARCVSANSVASPLKDKLHICLNGTSNKQSGAILNHYHPDAESNLRVVPMFKNHRKLMLISSSTNDLEKHFFQAYNFSTKINTRRMTYDFIKLFSNSILDIQDFGFARFVLSMNRLPYDLLMMVDRVRRDRNRTFCSESFGSMVFRDIFNGSFSGVLCNHFRVVREPSTPDSESEQERDPLNIYYMHYSATHSSFKRHLVDSVFIPSYFTVDSSKNSLFLSLLVRVHFRFIGSKLFRRICYLTLAFISTSILIYSSIHFTRSINQKNYNRLDTKYN